MPLIGGQTLPIAAGTTNAPLTDPVVELLLDYIGWTLSHDLDAKLARLHGRSDEACPEANRFRYDPGDGFERGPFPALYVWWPGVSRSIQETLVHRRLEREIHVLYVFDELVAPDGLKSRAGLLAAVDRSLAVAFERGRHPEYTPPGGTLGQRILTVLDLSRLEYLGSQRGQLVAKVPQGGRTDPMNVAGSPRAHVTRGFPALQARIDVWERLSFADEATTADADLTMTMDTGDDVTDPAEFIERKVGIDEGLG